MRRAFAALPLLCFVVACEDKPSAPPPAPSSSAATAASAPSAAATASAAPKPSMAEMQTATIKLLTDAWTAHDAHLTSTAYAGDGVLDVVGVAKLKGREQIESFAKRDLTGFPDAKVAVSRVWHKDNVTVVEWVYTGTNTGDYMGKKPTGRPIGVAGVSVSTFDDEGLIKEERRYYDAMTVASQLDPKAKPGSFRPIPPLPTSMEKHVAKDDAATLKVMTSMYAAFEGHKVADFLPFIVDDTTYDDFSAPAMVKGKRAIGDVVAMYDSAFPDFKQTHTLQLTADGFAIDEGVLTGTHKGAIGPLKATNKPVTIHFVDIWQIKDAKIVAGRTYVNTLEMLVEIGAAPAPGSAPAASASAAASAAQPATKASAK